MSNPSKQKGTKWENKVLAKLQVIFPRAERRALRGANDAADFSGCGAWLIEAKSQKSWRLHEWMRDLRKKAHGAPYAIIANRDGRSDRPLAILDADEFYTLLSAYENILRFSFKDVEP